MDYKTLIFLNKKHQLLCNLIQRLEEFKDKENWMEEDILTDEQWEQFDKFEEMLYKQIDDCHIKVKQLKK